MFILPGFGRSVRSDPFKTFFLLFIVLSSVLVSVPSSSSLAKTIVIELGHSTSAADEDYGQFLHKKAEGEWRSPIMVIRRPFDVNEAWC